MRRALAAFMLAALAWWPAAGAGLEPCDVDLGLISPPPGESDGSLWVRAELSGPCSTQEVVWSGTPGLSVTEWKGDASGLTVVLEGTPGLHTVFATRDTYQGVMEIWISEAWR